MTNQNDDPIRDIKSESDKWLEKLAKPSSSAYRRYVDTAKLAPLIQHAEPQIFDNIRSGTAARLWQNVRFSVLQWIVFAILLIFVADAIRGDGWSMAISTLLVFGVSASVLPLSIDKSKNQPYPIYLLASNSPKARTLNLPGYFFVLTFALSFFIYRVSDATGGRFHYSYTVLPFVLIIASPVVAWTSSNRPLLRRAVICVTCSISVFASLLLFLGGADGSARIQNLIGLSYYRDSDYVQSIEYYSRAIKINSANSTYLVNRGYSFFMLKDRQKSLADVKRALRIDPKSEHALGLFKKLGAK